MSSCGSPASTTRKPHPDPGPPDRADLRSRIPELFLLRLARSSANRCCIRTTWSTRSGARSTGARELAGRNRDADRRARPAGLRRAAGRDRLPDSRRRRLADAAGSRKLAAAGAWAWASSSRVIPDAIDQGEEPFIRPFMAMMGDDHYALDIRRARAAARLGAAAPPEGRPAGDHRRDEARSVGWYKRQRIKPPAWATPRTRAGSQPRRRCAPAREAQSARAWPLPLGAFRQYRPGHLADDCAAAARRRASRKWRSSDVSPALR